MKLHKPKKAIFVSEADVKELIKKVVEECLPKQEVEDRTRNWVGGHRVGWNRAIGVMRENLEERLEKL